MTAFPIQINATSLFYRDYFLNGPGGATNTVSTREPQNFQLTIGSYNLQFGSGMIADFNFVVTADGTVDFEANCDGFLSGRGTATLTISGLLVTLDGLHLTGADSTRPNETGVLLANAQLGTESNPNAIPNPEDWIALRTIRLLPVKGVGLIVGSALVATFTFDLKRDGTFDYDPAFDLSQGGFLSGQGTSTLTLLGYQLTLDATGASDLLELFVGSGAFQSTPVTRNGKLDLVLLPTDGYSLLVQNGDVLSFNLDLDGKISFGLAQFRSDQSDSFTVENAAGKTVLRVRPFQDFHSPIFGKITIKGAVLDKWISLAGLSTADGRIVQEYLGSAVEKTGQVLASTRAYTVQRFERGVTADLLNLDRPVAVYGAIYLHYHALGEMGSFLGAPIADEAAAPGGGRFSAFENGDIYWRGDIGAWEIHGAIRDRWLALGGPGGILGYPTSDESPVLQGATEVGRVSRFEAISRDNQPATVAAIYFTAATGAFEIYGPIWREWQQVQGGPLGVLGFPSSGPQPTPNGQGRFQTFKRGLVVWHPDTGTVTVTGGVALNLFSYTCDNNFNVQIDITSQIGGVPGPKNHGRMPPDGEFSAGSETFPPTPLLTIDQVTPDLVINVNQMEAISENLLGDDDREGNVAPIVYNIDNAWGLRENSHAHLNGAFIAVLEVQPLNQALAPGVRFRRQLFWPFHNFKTLQLSWAQYEETFRDVAEVDKNISFDPLHPRLHLAEIAVYETVYNSLARGANCFGMCLEAIYAREHRSLFNEPVFSSNSYRKDGEPLLPDAANPADQPDNVEAANQINVKQGYQIGSDMIGWFLGKWTAGALHDPVRAFRESRAAFQRGDWPILSISDKDKLSQTGHAVLPYAWNPDTEEEVNAQPISGQTWTIFVANPNSPEFDPLPNQLPPLPDDADSCKIIIDPFNETFSFLLEAGAEPAWTGSKEDGGRLLTIPYSMLSSRPTSPADLIADLFTGGVLIALGGDGQTSQITDTKGRTLYQTNGQDVRRVNEDAASRIPGLALLPVHQASATPVPELYFWQPDPAAPQLQHALQAGGDHTWTLHSAALSTHVAVTGGAAEAGHQIVVDSLGTAEQTVSLSIPAAGTARQVEMSLAGWFGTNLAQAKWFELKSMTASPGQTLRAQVLNAGQTLSLHNDGGPDTTFDLATHFGLTNDAAAVRTNVKIPSGKAWRVELADWTPAGMANVALNVEEMDQIGGAVLRTFQL
jgi:LGFP repeat